MPSTPHILVAAIGATATVVASFFTAQAAADNRIAEVDVKVEVLTERQTLQYRESKEAWQRVEGKLDYLADSLK
jgi:hypothetical protein